MPIFIFDSLILDEISDKCDARVEFILNAIIDLKRELKELGSDLLVLHGAPIKLWNQLVKQFTIGNVYTNRDYESYALRRDAQVRDLLAVENIAFHTYKDHVIFESDEVLKDDGKPYTVFTPYSKKWKAKLASKIATHHNQQVSFYLHPYPTEKYFRNLLPKDAISSGLNDVPNLRSLGFLPSPLSIPSKTVARSIVKNYADQRNYPSIHGTTRLGIHFRFGTISIREKALAALSLSETYFNELIWRDFYSMILQCFPYVEHGPFRPEYDRIQWRDE